MITIITRSVEETESLGRRLGKALFPGAFLVLKGDLGAGKTALSRGIGEGMGVFDIMSPTFTIVQEHEGTALPLFHFDAYRLGSEEELYDIGFEDYLSRGGAILMEWPEHVKDALPEERLEIRIGGSGDMPREITLQALGVRHGCLEAAAKGAE